MLWRDYGGDVERVLADHPTLDERRVQLALAYAARFPEEIEAVLAANARPLSEVVELYPFMRHRTTG